MLKKIMHGAVALALVIDMAAASAQPAEAQRRGIGAGLAIGTILGLGIAGAYAGPRYYRDDYGPVCYRGPGSATTSAAAAGTTATVSGCAAGASIVAGARTSATRS